MLFLFFFLSLLSLSAFAADPRKGSLSDELVAHFKKHRLNDIGGISDELREAMNKISDADIDSNLVIVKLAAPYFGVDFSEWFGGMISISYMAPITVFKAGLLCAIETLGGETTLQQLNKYTFTNDTERLEVLIEVCQNRAIDMQSWSQGLSPGELALFRMVMAKGKATYAQVNQAYNQFIMQEVPVVQYGFIQYLIRHQLFHTIPVPLIPYTLRYANSHPQMISQLTLPTVMPNIAQILPIRETCRYYPREYVKRLVNTYGFSSLVPALQAAGYSLKFIRDLDKIYRASLV